MTIQLVPAAAQFEWQPFRVAMNATSPFWNLWRSRPGYFVIERHGIPCWVGRTWGSGLKVALSRWIEAGAPTEHDCWTDRLEGIWESRILFVTVPDVEWREPSLPGRAI
jgi:hypothetical protein